VISIVLAFVIGGPGVIAIPIPALLWCALNYELALTVILTLLFSIWQIQAASTVILLQTVSSDPLKQMMSIRLGIALLALGPLTVASINAARNELLRNLDYAVNHDFLTKVLARGAFMKLASSLLFPDLPQKLSAVVLMLDIDHFKRVNDRYGHSVGDKALVAFASAVSSILREGDLFGRLGGEEFAIILPKVTQAEATEVAERIRCKIETTPVPLDDGEVLNITASIGVVHQGALPQSSLESILSASDQALYRAKRSGRNRVVYAGDSL
jgi:diguanylate cyclase (GGDEF)-like protein